MAEEKKKPEEEGFSFEKLGAFLPFLQTHRQLFINVGICIVLAFVISVLTTNLGLTMKHRSDTQDQIAGMELFIQNYNKQVEELDKFPKGIIDQSNLDREQSNIIFSFQTMNLNLISLREERDSGEHGKAYTVNFNGSYEDTMRFLGSLHDQKTLVGIKSLKLKMVEGKMDTTMTYKIYYK